MVSGRKRQQSKVGVVERPQIIELCQLSQARLFRPTIMSRQPSPGPSTSVSQPPLSIKIRQKPSVGLAAGAEDAKYQAKYKDLKRKVKEIEAVSLS